MDPFDPEDYLDDDDSWTEDGSGFEDGEFEFDDGSLTGSDAERFAEILEEGAFWDACVVPPESSVPCISVRTASTGEHVVLDTTRGVCATDIPSRRSHHQTMDCISECPGGLLTVLANGKITGLKEKAAASGTDSNSEVSGVEFMGSLPDPHQSSYSSASSADGTLLAVCGGSMVLRVWGRAVGEEASPTARFCSTVLLPNTEDEAPPMSLHQMHALATRTSTMLNCVRFGRVAGKERIVVSGQNGVIYILELPRKAVAAAASKKKKAANSKAIMMEMQCERLRDEDNPALFISSMRPEEAHTPIFDGACLPSIGVRPANAEIRDDQIGCTTVLGPFPSAVNCAAPSPDGHFIAVVGDNMNVLLLPDALDYNTQGAMRLSMESAALKSSGWSAPQPTNLDGCQYAAWSATSEYLAVSSDSRKCVAVWRVEIPDPSLMDLDTVTRDLLTRYTLLNVHGLPPGDDDIAHFEAAELARYARVDARRQRPDYDPDDDYDDEDSMPEHNYLPLSKVWRQFARVFWSRVRVTKVAMFCQHELPCLALSWLPACPSVLVYAEASDRVWAVDVRLPHAAVQRVELSECDGLALERGDEPRPPRVGGGSARSTASSRRSGRLFWRSRGRAW